MNFAAFQKRSIELFPETPDHDQSELLKTIRIPKNLMYLSNRLPMANYDFKGRKNQTVKVSRSINAVAARLNRGNRESTNAGPSTDDVQKKHHIKN